MQAKLQETLGDEGSLMVSNALKKVENFLLVKPNYETIETKITWLARKMDEYNSAASSFVINDQLPHTVTIPPPHEEMILHVSPPKPLPSQLEIKNPVVSPIKKKSPIA